VSPRAILKKCAERAARVGVLRRALIRLHLWRRRLREGAHPFDRANGVTTAGILPAFLLRSGSAADGEITAYVGVAASVLRTALAAIPDIETFSFVDLGAGMGRALVVASEFPFRAVVGIEICPELCAIAARNAETIRRKHPERARIEVREGDASRPALPDGPLVLMLYFAFGPDATRQLIELTAAAANSREIYLLCVNPVLGALIDEHASFERWYAEPIPVSAEEAAHAPYAPGDSEAVVIWRAAPQGLPATPPLGAPSDASRRIVVKEGGWAAELA